MNNLLFGFGLFTLLMTNAAMSLFDFSKNSDLSNWTVVDDVVMGGRSDGHFSINEDGNGLFYGNVSLENYGGFSSVRYRPETINIEKKKYCKIRLKGDGKRYQFRVKSSQSERQSYINYFETSGEWETISIALTDLYPTFRGRQLDMPNYPAISLEEVAFLIANKKAETFQLELDWITLE